MGFTVGIPMTSSVSRAQSNCSMYERTCAVQSRHLPLELCENPLYNAYRVQFIAMNSGRKRELLAILQTLRCPSCHHDRNMNRVSAIEFANSQIIPRDSLRRHIHEVQLIDDPDTIQDITGEVCSSCAARKDRSGRESRFEQMHGRVDTCIVFNWTLFTFCSSASMR
jgi:hypothetical protein